MFWYGFRVLVFVLLTICFVSKPILANDISIAQKLLTDLGYAPGPIDGSFGGKTKRALENYYAALNKKFDGKLDKNEITDLKATLKNSLNLKPKLKKSRHIQHARYSKHIATQFRDLKVSKDFTLIDDFDSFIELHKKYLKLKLPDSSGIFSFRTSQGFNFDFCVQDFINTTTKKANPSKAIHNATAYCGNMISQRFLNNPKDGINLYRKIILGWLNGGVIENPNLFGKKLPEKLMEEWPYAISSNVPNILTHYALYHKLYSFDQFTHERIVKMGEAFYTQWDYYPLLTRGSSYKQKLCNLKSQYSVVIGTNDHCGSYTFRMATGGIYFGLEFNSQFAFDTGVRHLEVMLATFNKDAVYAAQAHRGICALGYMGQFTPHFELIHYAFQKAYGIDFINTKNINGITPAEAYLKLWKIAHDPLETVVKYWNKHNQMSCTLNGKNQAAMVAQLKKYPSSYKDFWNGFSYEDFLLSSPILASQELPKEWKSFDKSKVRQGRAVLQTPAGNNFMGISPYLLQLALGNFEDERQTYDAERKRIKEEERKKKEAVFKKIKEDERKKAKAERLRKREMVSSYNGTYKIHLGINHNVIDGKMYQDFGAILFTLNRGQPKLDENNILYQALGLSEINFSLDYDGYMIVSGKFLGEINSEKRCVYIAGNLKSDKKFTPKSSQNCGATGQSLAIRFEKISDDVDLDFVDEKELKKLDGEYDVQWFITGINYTERTLRAKDTLTLSNGIGVFSGNEPNKQPSSELRKELSVQHNTNGEIVILGKIDLIEKKDVKKWYASGKIHPTEKTTIKTVWGFGNIIELEIKKSKGTKTRNLIKENGREKSYVKTKHIQHSRFSKHIATPFRDLKVSEDFTLIDNFESFMGFHKKYLAGQLPDQKFPFSFRLKQGYNFDYCVEDFIRTTTNKSNPKKGVQMAIMYCGEMISQRFLNNPESGIKNYSKIINGWLENGIIKNPNKFARELTDKQMQNWPYSISSSVPNILTHYALYYKLYNFDHITHQNILRMGEAFYAQWDYYPEIIRSPISNKVLCDLKSQIKVVTEQSNHCGSFNARMATGGILFGLEFNSQLAFDTGIRHLEIMLSTFNKHAVYAAQAHRGICALGYMKQFPPHFELIHFAFKKAYGIDFINTQNINGVTPAQAYLRLWEIAHDPLETVVEYWYGVNQMSCSQNGKNQAEMVKQLKEKPMSYQEFWNGFTYPDFLLKSPIFAQQLLPDKWKMLDKSFVQRGVDVEYAVAGGDLIGINPYLLQLALGNFEDERDDYIKEQKETENYFKNRKLEDQERRREILSSYNGVYKVNIGIEQNIVNEKLYQSLGSIRLNLHDGLPKFDKNNIFYDALGLSDINFLLDYEFNRKVTEHFDMSTAFTISKCMNFFVKDIKSDEKLKSNFGQDCNSDENRFLMKFEKISLDVNFDLGDEKKLKKLDGKYDVQWFMTGKNSTERTVRAIDKLRLSNGVGVFEGNEPNKQPSSELRKKLSVQYNANGEIVILGKIDLMEKLDVKKLYASGEIHPTEKTTIKTVWGFGDIIELEIEKSNLMVASKANEPKTLIHGDGFIYDEKNNSYRLKSHDEITGINQIDFSLSINLDNEKLFNGDIAYSTNANNFETTWIDLKVKGTNKVSQNIKIGFVIEERSFPNFAEAFSISKNECGVFEDMADDSFIIPLKTDDLFELELFDCHVKVLQEKLNDDDFEILKDRINTAISLVHSLDLAQQYF